MISSNVGCTSMSFARSIFDFHGPGCIPAVIEDLGALLCAFPDVSPSSNTDVGSWSVLPFEIFVPPDMYRVHRRCTLPVTSRPYPVNPIVAKEVYAIWGQYLAAVLIQHSTSLYGSSLAVIPKKQSALFVSPSTTRNLTRSACWDNCPFPLVDDFLDSLVNGQTS